MRSPLLVSAVCCLILSSTTAMSQTPSKAQDGGSNPFGSDPFGSGDPFAGGNRSKVKNAPAKSQSNAPVAKASRKEHKGDPEQRILTALGSKMSQTFIELPLSDAMQQLSQSHDIPIVLDRRALEELGLTPDVPITLSLNNVTLRSFLRLCLREYDLTYLVDDEVMQITTTEAAEQHMMLKTYNVPETLAEKADKIIAAMTTTVTPEQWEEQGGKCSVASVDHVLVVNGSPMVHDGVSNFLQKLAIAYQKHLAKR